MTEDLDGLRQRFDRFVDRSGEHHRWTGAVRPDTGVGRIKVDGTHIAAPQLAWILAFGSVPNGARIKPCADDPTCVRVEHLGGPAGPRNGRTRSRRGPGSVREVSDGIWELSVTAGTYDDGRPRRRFRRVRARSRTEASKHLAAFVAEVQDLPAVTPRSVSEQTFDAAVRNYLAHLGDEKGRESKTVDDYWRLHEKWFGPFLGHRPPRDVETSDLDARFGAMRRAGLSRSRMNQARSLYAPFFRWAKANRLVDRNPMLDFQLPTSSYVSRERTPPEVDELCELLNAALFVIPDVAPLLTLGAVSGMRRGELVAVRRRRVSWTDATIRIDSAIDAGRRVKRTKTRKERTIAVDDATIEMLRRHCEAMDGRAALAGTTVSHDAYLFSNALDCSEPLPPDYVTKRVAVLKDHLGIADKRPATIALEDEALRLYRLPAAPRPAGRTGPAPRGGMSFREIGARLARSERWVATAIASAQHRERNGCSGRLLSFDGSILALRKFTSSELLDAGFNISMVAHRQGHGPQVLVKHYSKSRASADRRAATHLGAVVHKRS